MKQKGKQPNKKQQGKTEHSKMIYVNLTMLIIILNAINQNTPMKKQRFSKWIKKQDWTICHLLQMHCKYKATDRLTINA